jgi:hypothetical protein
LSPIQASKLPLQHSQKTFLENYSPYSIYPLNYSTICHL